MNYVLNVILNYYEELDLSTILTTNEDIDVSLYEKEFFVDILGNKKIKEIFNNPNNLISMKKELKELYNMYLEDEDNIMLEIIKKEMELLEKMDINDIYENISTVFIVGSVNEVIKYINENPEIKGKRVVIKNPYSLSEEALVDAKKDINNILNNTGVKCSIVIEGNQEPTTIEEFEKVFEIINNMVTHIKKLNMSPLEEIMYAYDIVRSRVYCEEDNSDLYSKSRNIASVLLGKYIVCAGFTNILNTILEKLDIKCGCYFLNSTNKEENGHVRTIINVEDDKYDVHGIYLFDPTIDSKREEEDNSFINQYFAFGKTLSELDVLDKIQELAPKNKFLIKSNMKELETILSDPVTIDNVLRNRLVTGVNSILELLGEEKVDIHYFVNKSKSEVIEFFKNLQTRCNKSIPLSAFTKLVCNVKKIEYYTGLNSSDFNKNNLDVAIRSNLRYQSKITTPQEYIDFMIFNTRVSEIINKRYYSSLNLIDEKEIEQVRLTKTLRKILEANKK